ncbi:hypothetical protein Cni_G09125 [Canna indica]|uniref:BED-type domain-containing protein n=1 Tax=Canna indica TaxID=4628 RepID=A0AAQ3K1Y8_9LILI|nr:hypothetical protein Cni_G09125 [Canna indica]
MRGLMDGLGSFNASSSSPPPLSSSHYSSVFQNYPLISAILAFAIAQSIKFFLTRFKEKRWDAKRLIGSGGMPSSHSATVTALAVAIGIQDGLSSSTFATAIVIASVVMYDAFGVRLHAGKQAEVLNQIVYELPEEHPLADTRPLRELLGHTPLQVTAGGILGCIVASMAHAENMSSTAENSTTNTGNIIPQLQERQGQQEQQEHQEQTTQERVVLPSTQGGTSKSKVRGKRKSCVWDHFDKIECKDNSDQRATCKYCEKSLACSTSSGTSCLSNHLNRCKKYPTNVEKSQRTLTFKPLASGNFGGTTHTLASWKFDQEECIRYLAKMIITDEIPFRFVEHEGFRQFCRSMQPLFVMPSRFTVARDSYELYKQEKLNFMKYLKKLSSRICLTTDAWTSIQNLKSSCDTTGHAIIQIDD